MIGLTKKSNIHKSLMRVGTDQIDIKQATSRLCPINRAPKGQTLYDTIAFVIFCPKHKCIAVCNTYHSNREIAVWLPFIHLSDKVHYSVAIEDGLCLILSDYDHKLLFKYKEEVPFHTKITDAIQVYVQKTNKSVIRINCLATLHNNTGFECCLETSRIHWISIEDVCLNGHDHFWGPQVYRFCIYLKDKPKHIPFKNFFEKQPDLFRAKSYYQNYTIVTANDYLLYSFGITKRQIDILFIDFYEHCFPSLVMSFDSFADYLSKYGFRETNPKIRRLFNAFKGLKSVEPYITWNYLSFNAFLFGLIYIDKDSPHETFRLYFVFDYYDLNRDGFLSEVEFREMITDIHKNEGQEVIDRIVADGMNGNGSPNGISYEEFYDRAENHEFGDATLLAKFDANYLTDIYKELIAKTTRPIDSLIKLFK